MELETGRTEYRHSTLQWQNTGTTVSGRIQWQNTVAVELLLVDHSAEQLLNIHFQTTTLNHDF